ncbi:MAG: M3 family oligoendopeptidase [Chloroflexota bacterium]
MTEKTALPRWDMTNVYPSLDSKELEQGIQQFTQMVADLDQYLTDHKIDPTQPIAETDNQKLAGTIAGFVDLINQTSVLQQTIRAYLNSFISTDSYNPEPQRMLSSLEPSFVKLYQQGSVIFTSWLGKLGDQLKEIIPLHPTLESHAFPLQEAAEQSQYMMTPGEEQLAGELGLSGATAWGKLQGNLTSQLSWELKDENSEITQMPITAIINLRNHPNETMRHRGYEAELAAWETVETPLAAAMNGIKGHQLTVYKHRGREDYLHKSLSQARIDRETLDAMMEAMKNSFPMFRKYFKAKAQRLGKDSLPWWDILAPMGKMERSFSYPEAQQFVLENFAKFSEELADFADNAFKKNWVDVGPRKGKRAGAFCMGVPAVGESRVLLNFEENLDWVFTLAHELGHGYHNSCLRDKTPMQRQTPMTLAETASIMCETIVTNAAIAIAANPEEKLAILETSIMGNAQVVVDIYSRFLFETEVFERRAKAELSADELNEIMEWAQGETYGDALDPNYRQKYMWTWKPHYYYAGLAFYNYPYAFGMLFGTGLYAIYQERGDDFIEEYNHLLASTGLSTAAELAARFEIDLRSTAFWEGSLDVIAKQVEEYTSL